MMSTSLVTIASKFYTTYSTTYSILSSRRYVVVNKLCRFHNLKVKVVQVSGRSTVTLQTGTVYLCTDMPACEDEEHLSNEERQYKDIGENL